MQVGSVHTEEAVLVEQGDVLTLDLRLQPSACLTSEDFSWWCKVVRGDVMYVDQMIRV